VELRACFGERSHGFLAAGAERLQPRALVFDYGFGRLAALERLAERLLQPLERAVALVARRARRIAGSSHGGGKPNTAAAGGGHNQTGCGRRFGIGGGARTKVKSCATLVYGCKRLFCDNARVWRGRHNLRGRALPHPESWVWCAPVTFTIRKGTLKK